MYSRESVGPRNDPWGTPALTEYSCEEFPSRNVCIKVYMTYIYEEI